MITIFFNFFLFFLLGVFDTVILWRVHFKCHLSWCFYPFLKALDLQSEAPESRVAPNPSIVALWFKKNKITIVFTRRVS